MALTLFGLLAGAAQAERVWRVGPGGDVSNIAAAIKQAKDGDLIEVAPGVYRGDTAVIAHRQLTIRGLGAVRPVVDADGRSAERKGTWVIRGGDIRIENLEFRHARVPDHNGAALRLERGNLTVRNCAFIANETGIMTANNGGSRLVVEDSQFNNAVRVGKQLSHLLYVGAIAELQVRGSRFHQGVAGHLIKSRAQRSWIAYNLIVDGPGGSASYEVEFANGGDATLIGNVIAQSSDTQNSAIVAYGAEGSSWAVNRLRLSHNTLANERLLPAQFVKVWRNKVPDVKVLLVNNIAAGLGSLVWGADAQIEGNARSWRQPFAAPELMDYSLRERAWLSSTAVDASSFGADLVIDAEFRPPTGTRPLSTPGGRIPGAVQR